MRAEVLQRLRTRLWKPGERLPTEAELAAELGCARSTVNRALQALADEGLLERRRRGGTRVVLHPERKATLVIPLIRLQVEQEGRVYGYRLLARRCGRPPAAVRRRMSPAPQARLLHVRALHSADGAPWVLEDRWIDISVVPGAERAEFERQSANEWLVENVPFGSGELALLATRASAAEATVLGCARGAALFAIERLTREAGGAAITWARLVHPPGYRLHVAL